MPLDTSIIRQATFQPIQFKSPDRVNMLLQAAQAAQAVQGLEAGREERQARLAGQQRATQTQAALQEARKLGYTDEAMLSMSDALIGSDVPDLVNKGIALRESLREAAEYRRAFGGGGAPAGAAAMPAPAGAVATPAPVGVGAPQLTSGVNERGLAFPTTREEADRRWAEIQAGAPLPPAMSTVQPLQSIMTPAAAAAAPANAMAPSAPAANRLAAPPAEGDFLQTAEAAIDPNAPQRARLAQLLQHPQKNIREAAAASLGAMPGVTAEQKAYLTAVRQGFRGTMMEYQTALKKAGASSNTVKLPPQEGAFEAALGTGQAKKLLEDKAVADDARDIIATVQQGRQLLQSGMITGFGAEFLTNVGAALNQAGINFAEDRVANTQAFAANMAQNVGRIIKQFGAGTGLSNADREYAEKMAGGKITLDRKAIERILDINERAARNVITLHNKRASEVKSNIPLTVEIPPVQPAGAAPSTAGRPSLEQILGPRPAAPGR
jgi:hypothetical protein